MLSTDEIKARALRLSGRPANIYTGTPNDPFQEAQSTYAGPGWQQFFGGLQKTEEDAQQAGKKFRVDWSGFGNEGGGTMARPKGPSLAAMSAGDAELNPLEQQAQKQFLLGQQANEATERAKQEMAAQEAYNQAQEAERQGGLDKSYQNFALSSMLAPKIAPTTVTDTPAMVGPQQPGAKLGAGLRTITAHSAPLSTEDALRASMPATSRLPLEQALQGLAEAKAKTGVEDSVAQANRMKAQVEQDKFRAVYGAPPGPGVGPQNTAPITIDPETGRNEAALKTVPPRVAALVKQIVDGRTPLPSGTATKDDYWKNVIELAGQYDPNFDGVNYNSRFKTRQDFTSGTSAKTVNAINTVIGHLSDFSDAADKIKNGDYNWMNAAKNKMTPGGSPRGVALNDFNTFKNGVTSELTRVWRQAGGTEQDIKDWASTIGDSKSPQELHGALNTIGSMLESKLGALDDQYRQGMGTSKVSVIMPKARTALDKLQGRAGAPAAGGGAPPAASGQIVVTAPDGSTHPFATQAQADAFKRAAGIK